MSILLKFVSFFVLIVGIFVPVAINKYREDNFSNKPKIGKKCTVISTIIAVALFVVSCSFVIIPTGYTGVRSTFGQIDDVAVQNGFNWKIPFVQQISTVNNKQQDTTFGTEQIWSETASRTAIYYEGVTVTYQINGEKSAWIYANVSNYEESLVSASLVASAVKSSSKPLSDTDATNRSIIEPLVMQNLQAALDAKYGENVVLVNKVTISNADFEDSYNSAIAAKQQAQLAAEQQAIENQKAIEKAEADATVKLTTEQAEADAKIISANAEAEANKVLESSLTDMALRKMYIDKWDGKLPSVVAGEDGASVLIQPEE